MSQRNIEKNIGLFCAKSNPLESNKDYNSYIRNYRDSLVEYGIYCKKEEEKNWIKSCYALIETAKDINEEEWEYEAGIFESTALLLEALGENYSWDRVEEVLDQQNHDDQSMQDVVEMVLTYSPSGIEFVDNVVRKQYSLKELDKVGALYTSLKIKNKKDVKELVK